MIGVFLIFFGMFVFPAGAVIAGLANLWRGTKKPKTNIFAMLAGITAAIGMFAFWVMLFGAAPHRYLEYIWGFAFTMQALALGGIIAVQKK